MKRKLASLCLTSALCLSLAVPAFAAEPAGNADVENGVAASYQVDENTEVVYLLDGTKIEFSVRSHENTALTRAVSYTTGVATGSSYTRLDDFVCKASKGDYASVVVGNIDTDEDAKLSVKLSVTVNGTTINKNETAAVDEDVYINVTSKDGTGLACTFVSKVKPSNGANSVEYSYYTAQKWTS